MCEDDIAICLGNYEESKCYLCVKIKGLSHNDVR